MFKLPFYLVLCFYFYNFCESVTTTWVNDCFVELDYGRLRGETRLTSLKNKTFCSYKGIPYAKPPIGRLRFKDPDNNPEPWTRIKNANKEGKSCIQNDFMFRKDGSNVTSEDCLYLNVYTPKITSHHNLQRHNPLAVMVWIHGGGFLFGSGNEEIYGPDFLVERNVVLVTFNYRLGIFGFLNLGNHEVPGNAGLKDQVAVLLWVKKYIHLFGGNPNRVTIFGESAGAASVQYHMISDMSIGLFHQAILQSGSVLSSWAMNNDVMNETLQIAKLLNCKMDSNIDVDLLLSCLRMKRSEELRESQMMVIDKEDRRRGLFFTFLPGIEVAGTGERNFLTSDPSISLKNGNFQKVPSLIGFNNLEGFMFLMAQGITGPEALRQVNADFNSLIPVSLGLKEDSFEFQQVKNEVKKFYFNDKPVTWDIIKSYCDLIGDNLIVTPVHQSIKFMSRRSCKPIYTYEFAVDGKRGSMKIAVSRWNSLLSNLTGASHFDDVSYLFNFHALGELPFDKDSIEEKTTERLTTLWTNFAKTGNPNGGVLYGWEPQQVNQNNCLLIEGSSMSLLRSSCEPKRTKFWENIYETYSAV